MKLDWNYLFKCMIFDLIILFIINFFIALTAPSSIPYMRDDMYTNTEFSLTVRSVAEEIFWTPLIIGFFMTLIVSNGVRFDLLGSRVDPPEWYRHQIRYLRRFPDNLFLRAIYIALISFLIFFPITAIFMGAIQINSLAFWEYVYFKAIYSAIIGAFIGILIRIVALGD